VKLFDSWIAWSLREKVRDFFRKPHDPYHGVIDLVNKPDPVLAQKQHDETVARIKAWPIVAGFDVYNEELDGLWKDYVVRTSAKLAKIDLSRLSWNDEDKLLLDGESVCTDPWLYHPHAMEWDYVPVRPGGIPEYDIANMANYYAEHIKDRERKDERMD